MNPAGDLLAWEFWEGLGSSPFEDSSFVKFNMRASFSSISPGMGRRKLQPAFKAEQIKIFFFFFYNWFHCRESIRLIYSNQFWVKAIKESLRMSSVSPGNPADRLAPEVGWVCGWLWRGLGGGWHSRQAQQAFSWGSHQMWSLMVSGDALIPNLLGKERGTSAAVDFQFFFSFERKEALFWGTFWEHELSSWNDSLVGAPPFWQ